MESASTFLLRILRVPSAESPYRRRIRLGDLNWAISVWTATTPQPRLPDRTPPRACLH